MMVGNNVSHSKRRTKRTFQPNLFDKKFYLEEEDRFITLRVSAQGMRTINKNGLKATLDEAVKKGYLKTY
jgi:large subunit ribosomal protein L28